MKLHLQQTGNANIIRGYDADSILVNEERCDASLILTRSQRQNWEISRPEQIEPDHLTALMQYEPEIILLGTGHKHYLFDPLFSIEIMQLGTGLEIMTTEAACRTYNVLLGEDRNVLAALIIEN